MSRSQISMPRWVADYDATMAALALPRTFDGEGPSQIPQRPRIVARIRHA
jgi:hypothetical protein